MVNSSFSVGRRWKIFNACRCEVFFDLAWMELKKRHAVFVRVVISAHAYPYRVPGVSGVCADGVPRILPARACRKATGASTADIPGDAAVFYFFKQYDDSFVTVPLTAKPYVAATGTLSFSVCPAVENPVRCEGEIGDVCPAAEGGRALLCVAWRGAGAKFETLSFPQFNSARARPGQ
ncbi:hypothetical protein ACS7SF_10980 [Ralstonia sp. 25C]|uniref:hypothetical protein n=1 Tax=Ralstonia sp. 25C TaxID=3447363 RepID=UPI003F74F9AC